MPRRAIVGQAQALRVGGLVGTGDAAKFILEQQCVGVARVDSRLRHDHQVTAAVIEGLGDHIAIAWQRQVAHHQRRPRRQTRQVTADRRNQGRGHVIRRHQHEAAVATRRVEARRGFDQLASQAQHFTHLGRQLPRQGAGLQPPPLRNQQRVLKVLAQAPQCSTGRRLAKVEALRGPADAALFEQRIQGDQQIEIQTSITHPTLIRQRSRQRVRICRWLVSAVAIPGLPQAVRAGGLACLRQSLPTGQRKQTRQPRRCCSQA